MLVKKDMEDSGTPAQTKSGIFPAMFSLVACNFHSSDGYKLNVVPLNSRLLVRLHQNSQDMIYH